MITKLHHHTTGFGIAFGLPINDAIERVLTSARELSASAEKVSPGQSFGERITQAVKRRLVKQWPRIAADADNESFGEKLKKAVRKKSGQNSQAVTASLPPGVHEG